MGNAQTMNRNFETIAWGMLFVWWGITDLLQLPNGTGAAGIGLILLGVNAARSLKGLPVHDFSITLGILALVWGGLDLTRSVLHLPFELPVFAILLIVLGVTLLAFVIQRGRNTSFGDLR